MWRRGVGFVNYAASKLLERYMDIIAELEIGATAVLLVAHLAIVIRNRFIARA